VDNETDRQTDRRTDTDENLVPASADGVGKMSTSFLWDTVYILEVEVGVSAHGDELFVGLLEFV